MLEIASVGKLAIYWNENGLHAFTEYNRTMEKLLLRLGIRLTADNYVPFHFGQALLANHPEKMIRNRNILIVSGMDDAEFGHLNRELTALGCAHAELYRCSATAALEDDYTKVAPRVKPDVVFVAAGIGAAKVLTGLRHLDCPVIDIGGFIHVLSGKSPSAHSGFFVKPVSSLKTQEA
jgi:hypothetical protein